MTPETRIYAGSNLDDLMDITDAYAGFVLDYERLQEENKELKAAIAKYELDDFYRE